MDGSNWQRIDLFEYQINIKASCVANTIYMYVLLSTNCSLDICYETYWEEVWGVPAGPVPPLVQERGGRVSAVSH